MEPVAILESIISMGAFGLLFGLLLVAADRFLRVEEDPLTEEVVSLLPGTNCGGCGEPGCLSFARTLIDQKNNPVGCVVLNPEGVEALSTLLNVEAGSAVRKVARVFCQGGSDVAPTKGEYHGIESCVAVQFAGGGNKQCDYGCSGFGDCVRACPFDAMVLGENGIPIVIDEKCTGCNICVDVCPKNIIELHPIDRKLFVLCKSQDNAKVSKKVCKVSCNGCKLCTNDTNGVFFMDGNLAKVNYEILSAQTAPVSVNCPRGTILDLTEKESEPCQEALQA